MCYDSEFKSRVTDLELVREKKKESVRKTCWKG